MCWPNVLRNACHLFLYDGSIVLKAFIILFPPSMEEVSKLPFPPVSLGGDRLAGECWCFLTGMLIKLTPSKLPAEWLWCNFDVGAGLMMGKDSNKDIWSSSRAPPPPFNRSASGWSSLVESTNLISFNSRPGPIDGGSSSKMINPGGASSEGVTKSGHDSSSSDWSLTTKLMLFGCWGSLAVDAVVVVVVAADDAFWLSSIFDASFGCFRWSSEWASIDLGIAWSDCTVFRVGGDGCSDDEQTSRLSPSWFLLWSLLLLMRWADNMISCWDATVAAVWIEDMSLFEYVFLDQNSTIERRRRYSSTYTICIDVRSGSQ